MQPCDVDGSPTGPLLSVVIPVYNEAAGLHELCRRLTDALGGIGGSAEVILVNDGSDDGTAEIIGRQCRSDPRFRAVHLSRNFGHQAAVAAGLRYTRGAAVAVMDGDLQDPPELLPQLVARWREGHDVVYARHAGRRQERFLKRTAAYAYYRVLRVLAREDIPADSGDFCLMSRRIVEVLNAMPERNRYIRGLRAWVGFRQTSVEFERPPRFAGEAKYTFRRSLVLALNGIFSLSQAPLRLATYFGLLVSFTSFLIAVILVAQKLGGRFEVRGWASTVVILLFLGGVQLLTIGIIGEYIGRIYDEVKQRPLYVVGALENLDDTAAASPTPPVTARPTPAR